jgi:catechol 2,3-dioxygenase-like lactoylglutathione lyase family enzyme
MKSSFATSPKVMTFLLTRDRERGKAFYGGVLGFRQISEDPLAVVFDLNGTMLRISTVEGHEATAHTVLGWEVDDIAASIRTLKSRGAVFTIYPGFGQDDLGIWRAPGSRARVAWFPDPDGNNLSITQC